MTSRTPTKGEETAQPSTRLTMEEHYYRAAPEPEVMLPKSEIDRLIAERRELLQSGLYNENDEVIKVLTAQIESSQKQ